MRLGLIVDNLRLSRWQADALLKISNDAEFILLNCTNSRRARRPLKHAFYYALRLPSLKMLQTRIVPLPADLNIAQRLDFEARHDRSWQSLAPAIVDQINELRPAAIIKFGMGLLRVPENLHCPIVSYHHGDPRRFRGRPAGFYEMLSDERCLGQVVQILSNRLDAGKVIAFAQTQIRPHSYSATIGEAYRCSPLLLPKALENAVGGRILPIEPTGPNYRLPSNATVLRFVARTFAARLRRLAYGAFMEKRWQVASAARAGLSVEQLLTDFPPEGAWTTYPCPARYRFIADPFPHPLADGVLVEGLRKSDSQGEILHLSRGRGTVLCSGSGHFSFPSTVGVGDEWFLLPEVSEWSAQRIYRFENGRVEETGELKVDKSPRLIDPTMHGAADGKLYLFANVNDAAEGAGILRLWVAGSLLDTFIEHPSSPICISPAGARMAGAILDLDGRLYRFGQDGGGAYGDGLTIFAITDLTDSSYREHEVGRIRFSNVRGPHTVNVKGNTLFFDFYRNRFTALAGIRRLRSRLTKRRVRAD